MIALLNLTIIIIITACICLFSYRDTPSDVRGIYYNNVILIIFIGLSTILLYSFESLAIWDKIDLDDDPSYFFWMARQYSESPINEIYAFYPEFVKFLSYFMTDNVVISALIIRLSNLLLLIQIYSFGFRTLNLFSVSRGGYLYYSFFITLSGSYYGLINPMTRDTILLYLYALFIYLVLKLTSQSKIQIIKSVPHIIVILGILYTFYILQPYSMYICILGLVVAVILSNINRRMIKIAIVLLTTSALLVGYFAFQQEVLFFYQTASSVIEGSDEALRGGATVGLSSAFRFIFGPGLIRPLFPEIYFINWSWGLVVLYSWSTIFWYANIFYSTDIICRGQFKKINKLTLLILMFAIEIVMVYTFAYGGSAELRKRSLVYFLFTLFVASAFFPKTDSNGRIRVPLQKRGSGSLIISAAIVLLMIYANIKSIQSVSLNE